MNQNLHVNKTNFYMKGFAPGLTLKQRRKATRKSPIVSHMCFIYYWLCSVTREQMFKIILTLGLETQALTIQNNIALTVTAFEQLHLVVQPSFAWNSVSSSMWWDLTYGLFFFVVVVVVVVVVQVTPGKSCSHVFNGWDHLPQLSRRRAWPHSRCLNRWARGHKQYNLYHG